jgi:hypothetical protein
VTISQSTFVTNRAVGDNIGFVTSGGAIYSSEGTVVITNSTFFQNMVIGASGYGGKGGMALGGSIMINSGNSGYCIMINCTVATNYANGGSGTPQGQGTGGGIYTFMPFTLINTIVAGNGANSNSPDLWGALFVSSGVNLIGNNQGATGLSVYDFQNVSANLGTLTNNGGSTLTCVPLPGSYAIGYASSTGVPTTDQRGVPRPQNGAYDIGAVQTVTNSPYLMNSAFIKGTGFALDSIFDSTNKYRIQSSTNLTAWTDLYTNTSSGVLHFTDTTATNLNRRFYRTVKP